MPVLMTISELERFLLAEFPQGYNPQSGLTIEAAWERGCTVRQAFRAASLRPGGTISGPTMMALADFAMFVAVLSAIGPVPLAVTINLNINFLRKPGKCDLVADARLLKLGRRLATGEVIIHPAGEGEPVAHATSTYSIPPAGRDGRYNETVDSTS
jgi:uncharacterized protein (TIGR00369 family)